MGRQEHKFWTLICFLWTHKRILFINIISISNIKCGPWSKTWEALIYLVKYWCQCFWEWNFALAFALVRTKACASWGPLFCEQTEPWALVFLHSLNSASNDTPVTARDMPENTERSHWGMVTGTLSIDLWSVLLITANEGASDSQWVRCSVDVSCAIMWNKSISDSFQMSDCEWLPQKVE